jgi:hypothetical protein
LAINRYVLAGENITFRVRFRDDIGNVAPATNVLVHVFPPDVDTSDINNAYLASGVAVELGDNIWEYVFSAPALGPSGLWTDQWVGDLTYQTLDREFNFTVMSSGIIEDLGEQLAKNNYVTVTIASGIAATDGTTLDSEYSFSFLTELTPVYSSVRKVHIDAGGYLQSIPDDTVMLALLEASLEADVLTFAKVSSSSKVYEHARRQYVTCLAAMTLVSNLGVGLKAKTLDNFHVEYDTASIGKITDRLRECIYKWEGQLNAAGLASAAREPASFVKGAYDPDRPIVSRSWQDTSEGGLSRRMPAANTRDGYVNSRRLVRTWSNIPGFKKYW